MFQRDRDRILYCSAFRRLAGVTQIVRAGEADVFHTRLTHTLKVAQVGRRLAERRLEQQPVECDFFGVDAEVVEAACLAHDLGHPPFGHLGEQVLNELVLAEADSEREGDEDGFEGNAQSFRILTKLSVRFVARDGHPIDGLDLTGASLAACLKYPWVRDPKDSRRAKKWGVYSSELDDFEWARAGWASDNKTAEAELMDWADDIAYSVHDLEDFHRCRVIPWHQIFGSEAKGAEEIVQRAFGAWSKAASGKPPKDAEGRLRKAHGRLEEVFSLVPKVISTPYEGSWEQRQQLRLLTSQLIGRYIDGITLKTQSEFRPNESCVLIDETHEEEIRILKQITRDYVLNNPALAAQQKGHERILRELFDDLYLDTKSGNPKYFPGRFKYLVEDESVSTERAISDCIASLTEAEAIGLHGRLRGYASGSVLDPIVR
ncbi:deoxyguanosinetriphosphate triphosphohydrolase family protein [Pelagibius sp.]|uniref:deoxyguanosinetriphosphate triphosphohydrolase family protein n=1 Tax=Pelagibius sp. TaxID=1931238 RepID=UPI003BB10523